MEPAASPVSPNAVGSGALLSAALDAVPYPILVVDDDVRIQAMNPAAAALFGSEADQVLQMRGGDGLHCIHASEGPGGCGTAAACSLCVVRTSVTASCTQGAVVRRPARMQLKTAGGVADVYILVTTSPLDASAQNGARRAVLMFQDIGELLSNEGLVPVCMHCHKVRDSAGSWTAMDLYLKRHLDLEVTHGLCQSCLEKHYPEVAGPR